MEQQILKVVEILFGIGITALTPYLAKALITIQNKLKQELGEKNAAIVIRNEVSYTWKRKGIP